VISSAFDHPFAMSKRAIFSCLEIEKLASKIVLHFSINRL